MKKLMMIVLILLFVGCMSVADFTKASDLLDAKLAPYKAAIVELDARQDNSEKALILIDEKAGTKVLIKKEQK